MERCARALLFRCHQFYINFLCSGHSESKAISETYLTSSWEKILSQAIRNSGRKLIAVLITLLLGHTISLLFWLLQGKAQQMLISSPFTPTCRGILLPLWTWKLILGFGCMDLFLLLLTLFDSTDFKATYQKWKLTVETKEMTIAQRFYIDSVILFTVQISFIFAEVGWLKIYSNDPVYSLLPAPLWVERVPRRVISSHLISFLVAIWCCACPSLQERSDH